MYGRKKYLPEWKEEKIELKIYVENKKKHVERSDFHYNEFNKKNYKSWKKENTP